MSSEAAICVKGLGKSYQIYEKPHHRLMQMILGGGGRRRYFKEHWALKEIDFEVPRGSVVGVMGKNGAGKSTLLQILCGTLAPSLGSIQINGRIAALLELGAGFNPEFTGVENVYMNGQLLGLSRSEIDEKLDAILKFADIGDFVYQPVKTYSSGMYARLAFSVAVHVDPDILIVDEALSVGDSWFQHKSIARMRKLMSNGCTVLFVSHSIESIRALCDTAIWIDSGRVRMQGDVTEVTNEYMNDVFIEHNRITLESQAKLAEVNMTEGDEVATETSASDVITAQTSISESSILEVLSSNLRNKDGELTDHIEQGEKFSLEFKVRFIEPVRNISLGFLIKDQFGQDLTGQSVFNTYRHSLNFEKDETVTFSFASEMILRGGQSYSVAVRINQVTKWDRSDNITIYADELAFVFSVIHDTDNPMWFKFRQDFSLAIEK
ncbi:ABC transporter ATP-binding protein [Pseudomonas nitroreducens]|uniref:ABC transporter ATP-binding protein n=1 Tax=Pseudomonas nitroreducens TaxID=46680 RepID=UPI002F356DDB